MGLSVHDPFVDPLGNPLGLSKKYGSSGLPPLVINLESGTDDYYVPDGYSSLRVTVVGAGGAGSSSRSGCGGGCSRSGVVKARKGMKISYSVGLGSSVATNSSPSTADFAGISLIATGGTNTARGVGAGGLDNYSGGLGVSGSGSGGAGAAGYDETGAQGVSAATAGASTMRSGGCSGAGGTTTGVGGAGGGGLEGVGGTTSGNGLPKEGGVRSNTGRISTATGVGGDGGNWGGGGGSGNTTGGKGGNGLVRIELW